MASKEKPRSQPSAEAQREMARIIVGANGIGVHDTRSYSLAAENLSAHTLVPLDKAKPGDLLFKAGRCEIYMGDPEKRQKKFIFVDTNFETLESVPECNQEETLVRMIKRVRFWFGDALEKLAGVKRKA